MAIKKEISLSKKGMNKASAPNSLKVHEYTHAKNANLRSDNGEELSLTNEQSNLLASKFKEGYRVVGRGNFFNKQRVYFLLTNPDTGVSEIGYIQNIQEDIDFLDDTEKDCPNCDKKNILSTPLEEQEQTELQTYNTLLNDDCNTCLGLNIDFPVKSIVFKEEISGDVMYFTDYLNGVRYLQLDNIQQYTESSCLDCEKLEVFKNIKIPFTEVEEIINGGELKPGMYETLIAYCSETGEELSRYYSITNPVSIFNEQNRTISEGEQLERTNLGFKISIKDLDTRFDNYKVVVIGADFQNNRFTFVNGVYPTKLDTLNITTERNKSPIDDRYVLSIKRPVVEKAKTLATANNYLFLNSPVLRKPMNLQPIANLLGSFLKWQTHVAKESLYKDGDSVSKYKGYYRDETYAKAIRFLLDGEYSPTYLLVGRPPTSEDKQDINSLTKSAIEDNLKNCTTNDINEKWQVFNTASEGELCDTSQDKSIEYNTISREEQLFCETLDVATTGSNSFTISLSDLEDFTSLDSYINDNIQMWKFFCENNEPEKLPEGLDCNFIDFFDETLYTGCTPTYEPHPLDEQDNILLDENGDPLSGCSTPNIVEEKVLIQEIEGEVLEYEEAIFPDEYPKLQVSETNVCNIFKNVTDLTRVIDCPWPGAGVDPITNVPFRDNLLRAKQPFETSCSISEQLQVAEITQNNNFQSYSINYFFGLGDLSQTDLNLRYEDLLTNKIASIPPSGSLWSSDVHYSNRIGKNAKWFSFETPEEKKFIINVSRVDEIQPDLFLTKELRLSLYNSCSDSAEPIYTLLIDISTGIRIRVENQEDDVIIIDPLNQNSPVSIQGEASNDYYIAIDSPLRDSPTDCATDLTEDASYLNVYDPSTQEYVNPKVMATSTAGCFNVAITPTKNKSADASFDDIKLKKEDTFETTCYYQIPIVNDCEAVPYQKGDFAYTESEELYPDNSQLFNSQTLEISPEDIPDEHRDKFEQLFVENLVSGVYELKETTTDLRNKEIRHFKYPDNKKTPFCINTPIIGEADSLIFPMGCTIDEELINSFLDIALKNELISKKQRDRITGYEILRADRRGNETIEAKGITFDTMPYQQKDVNLQKEVLYSNFPFNDLGENRLYYDKNQNFLQPKEAGDRNNTWTFHSPDTDYKNKTNTASIMSVDGYLKGNFIGRFDDVRGHPGYVILGRKLENLASDLATLEVVADALIASMQAFSNYNQVAGFTNTVFSGAWVGAPIIAGFNTAAAAVFNYSRYKYQWVESFKNLGKPRNFAYYYTAKGYYSWLDNTVDEDYSVRPLNIVKNIKSGRINITDQIEGESLELNHIQRETTTFLKTPTDYKVEYPISYKQYDNTNFNINKSSRLFASQRGLNFKKMSPPIEGNVASMYVALKNYLPSQYGTVDSLETGWLTTGYVGDLLSPKKECLPIFGGDVFITRHTLLRRFPVFNNNAIGTADRNPFDYTMYSNIGDSARFFINYDTEGEDASAGRPLPSIKSEYNLDNEVGRNESYVKEPSKFYLYYNGIPNFLVESTINTWNRVARPSPEDNFWPNVEDFMEFTQEKVNSIKTPEKFIFPSVYKNQTSYFGGNLLPSNYDEILYNKGLNLENGTMYSLPDNNENIKFDPWLIFRQNDNFVFPTDYGGLLSLKGINRHAIVGRFNNTSVLFNAVDTISDDGQNPNLQALGAAGIFARRPLTLSSTDLGHAGSDVYEMVGSQYGDFYCDAKRGKVFHLKNPSTKSPDYEEISSYSNGKPNGMKHWFRKNLPFRVLNYFPNVDTDNPMNGVGITMGWDNQYNRVFITKKDYIPKTKRIEYSEGSFSVPGETGDIKLTNKDYFEDVGFTVAYYPEYGAWASFYDFIPNYYISHLNYFQTGKNTDDNEFGLWSHLLTNKSYGVFYGKKYDFEIEIPIKSEFVSKTLNNVELWTEAKRYKNQYDFDLSNEITFNRSIIYNNYNNSGLLELTPQKNNQLSRGFPKTKKDKQEILITNSDNFKWSYDYFFNRVKDKNTLPMFNTDINSINKFVNTDAVKFKGKRVLERLRGDWFLNRLSYNKDSRYSLTFKFAISETDN